MLFIKENSISASPIFFAYLILKYMPKEKEITIYKIFELVKKIDPNIHVSQIMYALMFLYLCDIILFEPPHIKIKYVNTQASLF